MPLALAASLLIVAGVGIEVYHSHQPPRGWPTNSGTVQRGNPAVAISKSILVDLPTEKAVGPIVRQVAIGPGIEPDGEAIEVRSGMAVVPVSHVAVASGVAPAHDSDSLSPYDLP
jgi:hypothetical protein